MAEDAGAAPNPGVKPVDAVEIVQGLRNLQAFGLQAMQDFEGAYDKAQAAAGAGAGAANAVGRAEVDVNNIVGQAALRAKQHNSEAAAAFGTNPNESTYVIGKMGEQIRESILKTEGRRASVQEDLDASFFDNPLNWLSAQFTLPFNQASLELNESRTASLISSLAKLQNLTLDQAKINAAVDDATSTSLIDAQNKLLLAKAAKDAAASQQRMAQLGIDRISMRVNLNQNQFDTLVRANDVLMRIHNQSMDERRLKLSEDANVLARERNEREEKLFQLQVQVKERNEEAQVSIQKSLDKATDLLGMRRLTALEFEHLPNNSPIKNALLQNMFSPDADFNRLGPSPSIAIERINAVPVQLPPRQEMTRQLLTQETNRVIGNESLTWKNYAPDVRAQKMNDALKAYYTNQLAVIPDTGGLYSPPPLASVIRMGGELYDNNPIMGKLRGLAADPNYAFKADDIVRAALEFVREQTAAGAKPDVRLINIAAANIAFIYQGIMIDNNTMNQYTKFAIPGLSSETGFKTSVATGSALIGRRDNVDMSKKEAVSAFLIRRLANEDFMQDYVGGMTGGFVRPQQSSISEQRPRRQGAQ